VIATNKQLEAAAQALAQDAKPLEEAISSCREQLKATGLDEWKETGLSEEHRLKAQAEAATALQNAEEAGH
jgi:hypothetical protein